MAAASRHEGPRLTAWFRIREGWVPRVRVKVRLRVNSRVSARVRVRAAARLEACLIPRILCFLWQLS